MRRFVQATFGKFARLRQPSDSKVPTARFGPMRRMSTNAVARSWRVALADGIAASRKAGASNNSGEVILHLGDEKAEARLTETP